MQQLGAGHTEFPIFKILFPCNLVTVKTSALPTFGTILFLPLKQIYKIDKGIASPFYKLLLSLYVLSQNHSPQEEIRVALLRPNLCTLS